MPIPNTLTYSLTHSLTHSLTLSHTHTHTPHFPQPHTYHAASIPVPLLSPSRSHLLLAQDDYSSRLNWVPGGQVVPCAQPLSILVGFPEAIPGCPGDADVMPAAIAYRQRQLGHLYTNRDNREVGYKRESRNRCVCVWCW